MTDRSTFTDEQWHAITDAPVDIMLAVALVGDHGPISMMKESAAGAKALVRPNHSGPADLLISQIAPEAKDKQARHDAKQHKGSTPNIVVDGVDGTEEFGWPGAELHIGDVVIALDSRRGRCPMTTVDPDTLEVDRGVLKDIITRFDGQLALNAAVLRPGVVRVGDPVELVRPTNSPMR